MKNIDSGRVIRLGGVKIRIVSDETAPDDAIVIPRRLVVRALVLLAGTGGVGAAIATAVQGGF